MVTRGFIQWALTIVVVVLIIALIAAATVVMASAILQPQVIPTIVVQPAVVAPGDIVLVTGKGWPALVNHVVVLALSPTRGLEAEGLVPVGATRVDLCGQIATTFVFPSELPWTVVREAWLVARPSTGNVQAVVHLVVRQPRPTATPTCAAAATPLAGQQQIQGTIAQVASDLSLMVITPFGGGANRGVVIRTAVVKTIDGRSAMLADLKVGIAVAASGWPDSGGLLLAEQVIILEAGAPATLVVPTATCVATPCVQPTVAAPPVAVVIPQPTRAPAICLPAAPQPVVVATCAPAVPLPAVALPVIAPTCTPVICTQPTPVGGDLWIGEYFPNPWLMGPPVLVRQNWVIDYNWDRRPPVAGLPSDGYSIRWTGNWRFPRTCRYRFILLLVGSARLMVDGQTVINQWDHPPSAEYAGEVSLAEGFHTLRVEYRNMGSGARIQLRWEYVGATF